MPKRDLIYYQNQDTNLYRAGNFAGSNFLVAGALRDDQDNVGLAAYRVNSWRFEIDLIWTSVAASGFSVLFNWAGTGTKGVKLRINNKQLELVSGGTHRSSFIPEMGKRYKITLYGISGESIAYWDINGEKFTTSKGLTPGYDNYRFYLGTNDYTELQSHKFNGIMYSFNFFEIDNNGDKIKHLVDLRFSEIIRWNVFNHAPDRPPGAASGSPDWFWNDFGSDFIIDQHGNRDMSIGKYRKYFWESGQAYGVQTNLSDVFTFAVPRVLYYVWDSIYCKKSQVGSNYALMMFRNDWSDYFLLDDRGNGGITGVGSWSVTGGGKVTYHNGAAETNIIMVDQVNQTVKGWNSIDGELDASNTINWNNLKTRSWPTWTYGNRYNSNTRPRILELFRVMFHEDDSFYETLKSRPWGVEDWTPQMDAATVVEIRGKDQLTGPSSRTKYMILNRRHGKMNSLQSPAYGSGLSNWYYRFPILENGLDRHGMPPTDDEDTQYIRALNYTNNEILRNQ
jgi:hypothetical protein